jgi:hypothetical protein
MLFSIPDWSWWTWLLLVISGLGCGFVNTLAGGGSLITLPMLIFLGLPPQIANATNRLALVFQTATATIGFRRDNHRVTRVVLWLAPPTLLGSWFGAELAVMLSPALFRIIFGILIVIAAIVTILNPQLFKKQLGPSSDSTRPSWSLMVIFLFIGIYSGFIQVGVGIPSLLVLLLLGKYNIHRGNAIKVQLLFLSTLLSTIVFLWHNQVILVIGLILAIGNGLGAWLATIVSRNRDLFWLRWLLLLSALAAFIRIIYDSL